MKSPTPRTKEQASKTTVDLDDEGNDDDDEFPSPVTKGEKLDRLFPARKDGLDYIPRSR